VSFHDPTIYFIQMGERGPVKIGYSVNPATRLVTLQGAHFERLHLVGVTPGSRWDEELLHKKLNRFALGHEWFEPAPEVFASITLPVARVDDALDKAVVAREHLKNAIGLLRASDRDGAHEEFLRVLALVNDAVAAHSPQLSIVRDGMPA
jgi:hypothetical protein